MPTISTFFGIFIRMYFDEHSPSHFHAYYGDHSAAIEIETLRVLNPRISVDDCCVNFLGKLKFGFNPAVQPRCFLAVYQQSESKKRG